MSIPETEGDFDFYLRFVKPLVLNLSEPNDRALAAAWVQKLRDENAGTEVLRTDYLKLLLFVLQRKKLIGVFSENPNQYETLENFPETNLHDVARELLEAEDDNRRQQNVGGAAGDFPPYSTEHSADLLEYSAAQDIPNFGVHAYYAISNEPLPKWERTEKAVFPRGAASSTERNIRSDMISRTSSATSEPTLDDKSTTSKDKLDRKSKSRDKSKYRPKSKRDKPTFDEGDKLEEKDRSRIFEGGRTSPKRKSLGSEPPSPPLGSNVAKDKDREAPTWGSNLIGVSEPPVRDVPSESLADLSEKETTSDSSMYPSLPYKTPSPRKPDGGEPCLPCGTPRPQSPYSPLFPEGEASPFFLGSPPSFLADASLADISSVKGYSPARRGTSPKRMTSTKIGERDFDLDELKGLGLDRSALGSDVFKLDNLEDFDEQEEAEASRSFREASIERRSIDDDLDAFDRMIAEYEKDDYVASPPPRSPSRSPEKRPPSPVPAAEPTTFKKVTKKKKVVKKVEAASSKSKLQQPPAKTIKRTVTKTISRTGVKPGPSAPHPRAGRPGSGPSPPGPGTGRPGSGPSAPCPGTGRPGSGQSAPCPGTGRPGSGPSAPCPGAGRPPGGSRILAPGSSRIAGASGVSRIPSGGVSRIPSAGVSRIPSGGVSRIPSAGVSRIPSGGVSRIPSAGVSRIPSAGVSRIPSPGVSRIPSGGVSRIPAPGSSRIPAAGASRMPRPVSRIPAPGRTGIPGAARILTSSPISVAPRPYSPLLPEGEEEPFFLEAPPSFLYESTLPSLKSYEEYPSLPIRTPSPKRPCRGSPCPGASASPAASPRFDLDELQELNLQPGDLNDDVFNLEGIHDIRASDMSSSSNIEYQDRSELNIDDSEIDRELDEWDRKIAELEAENAEDIALYGSPGQKSPQSPKRSPTPSPIRTLCVEAAQPSTAERSPRTPTPKGSRISATTQLSVEAAQPSTAERSPRTPTPKGSRISATTQLSVEEYSPLLPDDEEEPFFLESPPSFFDESTLPSLKSFEVQDPSLPIRTPSPRRPCPNRRIDMADLSAPILPCRPPSPRRPSPGRGVDASGLSVASLPCPDRRMPDMADLSAPSLPYRTPSPQKPAPGISRLRAPGASRNPPPGTSRIAVPGTSRIAVPGASRIAVPGASRIAAPGASRIAAPGPSRIATLGASRIPARGTSRIPAPGTSRIPAPGASRIPAPGSSRVLAPVAVPEGAQISPRQRLEYSPPFPEGDEDPFFLEDAPSFFDDSTLPSLKSFELQDPSWPIRTPSPKRPCPGSPTGPCSGSSGKTAEQPYLDADELKQLGLEPADLDEGVFNLEEVDNMNISDISVTSQMEYQFAPEFDVDDTNINRELEAWDKMIADLEVENAEDIALYGKSPEGPPLSQRSPTVSFSDSPRVSPARRSPNIEAAPPLIAQGSPAAQDIVDAVNRQLAQIRTPPSKLSEDSFEQQEKMLGVEPELGAAALIPMPPEWQNTQSAQEAANEQYRKLQLAGLEAEYKRRYKHRRKDMPKTPPMFSKYAAVMGEQEREYDPSEFGEIGETEWQSGEQFFEDKKSLSPRVDERRGQIKPFFPGIQRQPDDELFFSRESEPELMDIESEFETSAVEERSPAAGDKDSGKAFQELAVQKETMPAEGGLPVTTPRLSPSPRRTGRSIRVEMEEGEMSFEIPSFEGASPDRQDGLYLESPPHFQSPGSPLTPVEADNLLTPYGLPKRARFSPIKVPDLSEFYTQLEAQRTPRAPPISPEQKSVIERTPSPQQQSRLVRTPSPQQGGGSNILDRSITEGVPSPIQPPLEVPGWTTPPRLQFPKRPPRAQLLPGPAEGIGIAPGSWNIIGQEMPPWETADSPPQLSPGDVRPSPKHRQPSPCTPCTPSPRPLPPRAEPPRLAVPRGTSPYSSPLFNFAADVDLFGLEEPPEEMFQSPGTPVRTPPRSPPPRPLPGSPHSPVESPLSLRLRLLQGDEPPYYSKEEMEIAQGRSVCRRQVVHRRSAPPDLHSLREVPADYQEEHVPFLAQVEKAVPFSKPTQRIRVAAPGMDTVLESPTNVPEFTQADHIAGIRRLVRDIEEQHTDLPQVPLPEDLIGASGATDWQASPGELDTSFTGNLPSPIRPPTVVPGWTTPPRLKIPKRSPRPQLSLPGPAEGIGITPGAWNIIGQEMPPWETADSPPQLSPGDVRPSPKHRQSFPCTPCTPSPRPLPPRAEPPRLAVPRGTSPHSSPLFNFAADVDLFGLEEPPEQMFQSPGTPVRTPPRSPPPRPLPGSPHSPVESPFSLRMRLLQADEPPYYSKEEMEIAQGRSVCRRQVVHRRSAPPDLHSLREVPADYQEEHVPFLSQVEKAVPFSKPTQRIRVAAPGMDTVLESPTNVPEFTQADHIAGIRRRVRDIEERHTDLPQVPLPEDLIGASGATDWQASPGELDTSFSGNLPSPIRPPTVVPGWTTPPRLKIPKRSPRPQLSLPGPAEGIGIRPGVWNIIDQEIQPSDLQSSPPPLSPGEYRPARSPKAQPSPRTPRPQSPRAASPRLPTTPLTIFDASPIENIFQEEAPPEEMFQSPGSPVRTPPRSPSRSPPRSPPAPGSPLSPVESPFHLRLRLLQGGEPPYYSKEEMEIPQGRSVCRRQVVHRRSAPPDLHSLREVPADYREADVPFLAQVEGAQPFPRPTSRIRVAAPGMDTVLESPMNVPEYTHADHIADIKRRVQEIQQRHSPATRTPPDDLMGSEGPVDWPESPGVLDRSIPGALPSPIRPPTVVPGWITPPNLKKQPKQPLPQKFKLIPGLKDVLFQEMPPAGIGYSPPPLTPKSSPSTPCRPCSPAPKSRTATPRTPPRSPVLDVWEQEPEFLAVELPPDEFLPSSPSSLENSMTYEAIPFSPGDTIASFEEHGRSPARSPIKNVPVAPSSPTQQLDEREVQDTSIDDYDEIEKAILAEFSPEPKARVPAPSKAVIDKMIRTGGEVNRQIAEMQRSPTWLEQVELKIRNVPDPHLPRRKPYSPQYGQISPTWSPKLPKLQQHADQIEEEFVPEEVWGYESPKSPVPSPKRPSPKPMTPRNIFDVTSEESEYLDEMLPPQLVRSPTSPPTPPRIDEYYAPHTPTSPGSPNELIQSVRSHEFTDRYYDKDRKLMMDTIRVKNRVMKVTRPKRPGVSPIKEGFREDSPIGPRDVPIGELVPVNLFGEEMETTEEEEEQQEAPDVPPYIDRAVPQVGLPLGMADPGLSFFSPPKRTPRRAIPSKFVYVPGAQYKEELTYQSPPEFYQSPPEFYESPVQQKDIFDEDAGSGIFESTPPRGYAFTPPQLSPPTPPPSSPCLTCSPESNRQSPVNISSQSPPMSPSFYRSVLEHEYTDRFFETDRPGAQNIVRSQNKVIQLQRQSQPPSLEDIAEYDEEDTPYESPSSPCQNLAFGSPNYQLPMPVYYGSPGRQFVRTPIRKVIEPEPDEWEAQYYEVTVPSRIAFSGQRSPEIMDTSFIASDLDESFVEEDMSGFKWMG